ncbi:S-layer homology domain-containing protein [Patescibacteria group bacterium]
MKNSLLRSIFIAIFVFSLMSTGVFAFSDVPENHPNYTAIVDLQTKGVINGYPDGTFKPDQTVNRVEALKILLLGSRIPVPETFTVADFPDTGADEWYSGILAEAVNLEIVDGYPDGTFKPAQTVNLVEAVKMLLNTNNVDLTNFDIPKDENDNLLSPYNDANVNEWYGIYIWAARTMNLLEVDREGMIHPADGLTRGKMAEMMYRLAWLLDENELRHGADWPILKSYRKELSLDNLDQENGSDSFDFEEGWEDITFPSNDLWMGSLSINGNWTGGMDWQVVDMTEDYWDSGLDMEQIFDTIEVCPADGYSGIDDPDGDGWGEPRNAHSGYVYCLRTDQGNYAKIEVLEAYSENFGDDKYLTIRYIYRPDGSRELP